MGFALTEMKKPLLSDEGVCIYVKSGKAAKKKQKRLESEIRNKPPFLFLLFFAL